MGKKNNGMLKKTYEEMIFEGDDRQPFMNIFNIGNGILSN